MELLLNHRAGWTRVGALIGEPVAVDPARPNLLGRATPIHLEPGSFALYRAYKRCRRCHAHFEGYSLAPQYDDDEPQAGYCARCADAIADADRRKALEMDELRFGHLRKKRREQAGHVVPISSRLNPRDPLAA